MSKRLLHTYLNVTDISGCLDVSGALDISGRVLISPRADMTDISGALDISGCSDISGALDVSGRALVSPRAVGRSFLASDIRTIYGYPPVPTTNVVVGVISLGGTLTGSIDANGILTGGDVQNYWRSLGMTSLPTVKVVRINGSALDPSDVLSTTENTIDVQMVGACCPTSKLTIVLYFYNQYTTNHDAFYGAFSYAINTPVSIPGLGAVKPTIISCSWGASENLFTNSELDRYNTLFAAAAASGITITTAAGDYGSSNGTSGTVTDFPTSSPNVVSCGGTHLICRNQDASGNYIYTGATETTWGYSSSSGTGGGISKYFNGPPYPLSGSQKRHVPDLSLVADPNTGVQFTINGTSQIIGGTSIVSPAIAGLAACLPNAPKGLLKKLYALPSTAFYDITAGSNGAYSAGLGYDNCTGLGSVNGAIFVPQYNNLITSPITPLSVGITGTLTALVGATSQLSSSAQNVWWSSSNSGVATVTGGLVRGIAAGSTIISTVTKDGFFTSSVSFRVTSTLPPSLILSTSPNGNAISGLLIRRHRTVMLYATTTLTTTPVIWSTSNVNIATVSNGVIRAGFRNGQVIIRATCGTLRASVSISVN